MSGYSLTADDIAFRAASDDEWLVIADGTAVGTVMKRPAYTTPDHGVYYVHLYDDHAGPVAVEDAGTVVVSETGDFNEDLVLLGPHALAARIAPLIVTGAAVSAGRTETEEGGAW